VGDDEGGPAGNQVLHRTLDQVLGFRVRRGLRLKLRPQLVLSQDQHFCRGYTFGTVPVQILLPWPTCHVIIVVAAEGGPDAEIYGTLGHGNTNRTTIRAHLLDRGPAGGSYTGLYSLYKREAIDTGHAGNCLI
jgi:hypothetical protein